MLFSRRENAIRRILIVEDEPLVAFDNEHFLGREGYRVVATVDSVAAALEAIAAEPIDLVLADVSLSDGGDGVEVAREARSRGISVLFVTGHCPVEARPLALGCLAKPYAQRDLLLAIHVAEALVHGRKPRRVPRGLSLFDGPDNIPGDPGNDPAGGPPIEQA